MVVAAQSKSRKERRKEERGLIKKRKTKRLKRDYENNVDEEILTNNKKDESKNINSKKKNQDILINKKKKKQSNNYRKNDDDKYKNFDSDIAAAMRRDDEEIEYLEKQLGNDKKRLHREYADCYGTDDFTDFLSDIDKLVYDHCSGKPYKHDNNKATILGKNNNNNDDSDDSDDMLDHDILESEDEEEDEEIIPMKGPAFDDYDDHDDDEVIDGEDASTSSSSSSSSSGSSNSESDGNNDSDDNDDIKNDSHNDDNDDSSEEEEDVDDDEVEPDHDRKYTYRPSDGEDIYGNQIDNDKGNTQQPKKYIPPHLRNKVSTSSNTNNNDNGQQQQEDDKDHEESMRLIRRNLNSILNRLSEETIISVTQSIVNLYNTYPTHDVNECIWNNTYNACIVRQGQIMINLIPTYITALAGVHIQINNDSSSSIQLAEYILERVVLNLWNELQKIRSNNDNNNNTNASKDKNDDGNNKDIDDDDNDDEVDDNGDIKDSIVSKEVCNNVLILCYMYNFNLVHCTLLYDIIRDMIDHLQEIDIEILLLILRHCGRTLRSDDPSALKEIVLLVQTKSLEQKQKDDNNKTSSSRIDYMVSAMMDLKNNKRKKQEQVLTERIMKLRKILGHIKSKSSNHHHRSSDTSLRISLNDILNVETKGRWWKIGASWAGNNNNNNSSNEDNENDNNRMTTTEHVEDERLLQLAAKYRMNTDIRRTIFCIIMGSMDYEDCFEKLVKAGMLKNRTERDTVRVLLECCSNENTYNPYYVHLANRICNFQIQCKFTFQLAYWDYFKQFNNDNNNKTIISARNVANLAKFLYQLIVIHDCIKLNVLKGIDDLASPDDLSETCIIFITIFLSNILDHYDDTNAVKQLFQSVAAAGKNKKKKQKSSGSINDDFDEDNMMNLDDGEALQASLTVFLVQVMKNSPKYKKGTRFFTNLKAAIKACDSDERMIM